MSLVSLDAHLVPSFDSFVVPNFLSMFGELAMGMLLPSEGAVVASVGCRTGYPDSLLPDLLPNCHVVGFDSSEQALDQAREKAAHWQNAAAEYIATETFPLPAPQQAFSHAISIYPITPAPCSSELIEETARMLVAGGQLLYAMPLRGSYQELIDLLREFTLKHNVSNVAKTIETHYLDRPTIETFAERFENHGFAHVDVDMRRASLPFPSGREFFDSPIAQSLILPDLTYSLGLEETATAFEYVRNAIDRYWSEFPFELTLHVGCASARKY